MDTAFEVELVLTGRVIGVPADGSILEAVLDVLPDTPWGCREGYCGACQTVVVGGLPDHRDQYLTAAERASGATMLICVSRALGPRLSLDL